MSMQSGTFYKISNIVWFRQLLRQWRKKAVKSSVHRITGAPNDVPAGYLAVYVGDSHKRFVVRAAYLNHPIFQRLLIQAAEEYGFENQGPLIMPCEESEFEQVIQFVSNGKSSAAARFVSVEVLHRMCKASFRMSSNSELLSESRPLLCALPDKAGRAACICSG